MAAHHGQPEPPLHWPCPVFRSFIFGLKAASIIINRKMLSEVAIHDPPAFDAIVAIAKAHQPAQAA